MLVGAAILPNIIIPRKHILWASLAAGESDWKLVKKEEAGGIDEDAAIEHLGHKERMVDPTLYPKIKGARGIFKVKPVNVENYFYAKQALENLDTREIKVKHPEIAAYLLHAALH